MILEALLPSNSAIIFAKLTNIYSRVGGAYLLKAERKEHKFSSRDMAVFPIYATVPSKNDKSPQRLISGIMIREPHHARNPTDEVNVLTIELLTRDSPTWTFCHNINRAIIAQCSNFILVASQNSMKKIDPIHLTFN